MNSVNFEQELVVLTSLEKSFYADVYLQLPEDWWVVVTDVKGSTKAIEAGRYRDINAIGGSTIAAVINAVKPLKVPYVFGGDGASFCIPSNALTDVKKALKGWQATAQGLKLKAIQSEDFRSGIPYVRWPQTILDNKSLIETIEQLKGHNKEPSSLEETKKEFRDKFKATHRTTDGHMVRSKAEMLIDNWLYMAEIVHAYERKLPIEEDVYSDFYIPAGKVYIEYWGLEDQPKYLDRKKKKIEIYKKYGFNLIELKDYEVQNLDDHLPKLLLKYGVQAY